MGMLGLAVIALAVGIVYLERVRVIEEETTRAERLVHVLERQTARTFQAVDLTVGGIADALIVAPALSRHDPDFKDALRRKLEAMPFVRNLYVVGVDGFATQDTNHPRTPHVSAADREYFRVHRDDPSVGLYISPPLVSRAFGTWFISLSRRVSGRDGRFAGVAVAAVEPRYFERFYRSLNLSPGDARCSFDRRPPRASSGSRSPVCRPCGGHWRGTGWDRSAPRASSTACRGSSRTGPSTAFRWS